MPKDIGKTLKESRIAAKISVKQISDILTEKGYKASESTIYSWENGNSQPTPGALLTMCDTYGIDNALETFGYNGYKNGGSLQLTLSETALIEKYRTLDEHGKDMVNVVLDKEFDRCQAVVNGPVVINIGSKAHGGDQYYLFSDTDLPEHLLPKAAHERTDLDHEITDEDRQADLEILRKMKEGK